MYFCTIGILNKILPAFLKPISRDIGFSFNSLIYKIKSNGKNIQVSPIFILGNQKSGTSVIAALLGEYTSKKTAIDLFYSGFKYSLFQKWKNREISTSKFVHENKIEFSCFIIKEPHFSVFYQELKEEFPQSEFVMIVRNPFDNIRSILDRLNIEGNKKELVKQDSDKIFHSWNLLFNNNWIEGNKKQYIEVLSERWNIICNSYLENKNNITLVKYEDFLTDKEGTIKNLSEKLNLKNTSDISQLLNKQFQPKGKQQKVDVKEFFGEKNYLRIKNICGQNMKKIGY